MNKSQWESWKHTYAEQIQQIGDTQSLFIDTILSDIPEIQPSDIIPHYHFVDGDGANRYIDFLIINQDNNYLLPIEINGYAKMRGNQYDALNQFLEGKKAIMAKFDIVLCYCNDDIINDRENIVYEIRQTLENQNLFKSNEKIIASHTAQLIADYEHRLTELSKEQLQTHNNEHVLPLIKEMQEEINRLKQQQIPPLPNASEQAEEGKYFVYDKDNSGFSNNKSRFVTIALSVICSAVIVFFFTKKLMSKDDNASYQIKDKVIERKDVEQEKKQHLAMIEEQDKDIREPDFKVEPRYPNRVKLEKVAKPKPQQLQPKKKVQQPPKPTKKPVEQAKAKPTPKPVQPPKPQPAKVNNNQINTNAQPKKVEAKDKADTVKPTTTPKDASKQQQAEQTEKAQKQTKKVSQAIIKQAESNKKQAEKVKQEVEKQTEKVKQEVEKQAEKVKQEVEKQAEKVKQEVEKQTEKVKQEVEKVKQELEKQAENSKKQAEKVKQDKQKTADTTKDNNSIKVVESNEKY